MASSTDAILEIYANQIACLGMDGPGVGSSENILEHIVSDNVSNTVGLSLVCLFFVGWFYEHRNSKSKRDY
jgi:hypothetical protein